MPSTRELRLRVRSIKNLSQVTKALETVSASYVRKAVAANQATQPYAERAWKLLVHLARQPGHENLHPLLAERPEGNGKTLVVMVSGNRGLAGAYNMNILRAVFARFPDPAAADYVAVGRKGADLLKRRRRILHAEFPPLPNAVHYEDVSAIGHLVTEAFLNYSYDHVYLAYTRFDNMVVQTPIIRKLLPLHIVFNPDPNVHDEMVTHHQSNAVFSYEPDSGELLNEIVPRFTAIQIYQAILSSQASEHAARMVAMRNATENAHDLITALQMEYNKLRQNLITSEMLDIVGGANAQAEE